jgi:type IV pilus assembly protein PilO
MPLSPEDQLQVRNMGLLCAFVAAAIVFAPGPDYGIPLGIMKLNEQIKRNTKQVEAEKGEFDKELVKIQRIPGLEEELREREPDIKRYASRLPKSTKVPELFRDIDRFKQASGLDISVQTRLDPSDKGAYVELPIRIEALGTYDSIATFINQLERNQRFAQIKELKIEEIPGEAATGDQPDFTHHLSSMKISTFMFKDQVVEEESKAKTATAPSVPGGAAKPK